MIESFMTIWTMSVSSNSALERLFCFSESSYSLFSFNNYNLLFLEFSLFGFKMHQPFFLV